MKTRRQYLAYVRKQEAANVSPLCIMNEREFRGAETAAEKIARWEFELGELNARMLPLILAGEDHRNHLTNLYHMTCNARRIDRQIRECESLSSTEQPIVKIC